MAGNDDMQFPKRSPTWHTWNLNTVLNLVTLVSMLAGGVYIWANTTRDIEDLVKWRLSHEAYHKDLVAEGRTKDSAFNDRLRAEEIRSYDFDRKLDNLIYRVDRGEQSAMLVSSAIKDLQAGFNKQDSNIQVIKEILTRMEAAQQGRPSR